MLMTQVLKEQSLEDYIMLPFYMLENGYQKIMVTNLKVQQIIKTYLILLRSTAFDRIGNIRISDSLKELKKMRHQSDYYLKIPKKESKEYDRWNFGDINRAFKLARDIFDSFENSR